MRPFASATDSMLHRGAWRSTRAIEPSPLSPRRPPSRYRGQLRYDLLGSPSAPQPTESLVTSDGTSDTRSRSTTTEPEIPSPSKQNAKDAAKDPSASGDAAASTAMTNLDELRWFQHRWLDKHGRSSNLKATREQLTLMRRWFDSLDADGSGEVGLDELEDPLVSVGLAGSRDDVQHLIEEVDGNGTGGVTFEAFLNLLYPERVKRERSRRFPPLLHTPKHRPPARPDVSPGRSGVSPKAKRSSQVKANVVNPVARLFENLQEGKLGDLAIPFPVLITAYRRRMLLDAHMAANPAAKRVGSSVLQALEATRRENSTPDTYDWRRTHFDLQLPSLP
ncbi:Rhomboid- protein 3 [Phytophthora pseudosyringae]|uniref:Rhomboid- protein 3 n=1 Tax=Phytophthora pseudosyringae TaxID=221518 RepID=A0A8T1VKP6_9STRA|nr:Rhomboid- protein 3 [Phytophthora pseudosyringae]